MSQNDALWICQTELLRCLDSEARGTWRLVCKSACKAVEDNTRCLIWKERGLDEDGARRMASAQVDYLSARAALPKLDAADLQSVDWSPLARLAKLDEAVLQGIPASSMAALNFDIALRSLDISYSRDLEDIPALTRSPNLLELNLSNWNHSLASMYQAAYLPLVYNLISIPLPAGTMLPSMGMCLNPSAAAGMMMAFSSVAVVSNSLLLRARYGLGEVKGEADIWAEIGYAWRFYGPPLPLPYDEEVYHKLGMLVWAEIFGQRSGTHRVGFDGPPLTLPYDEEVYHKLGIPVA
eukprot:gene24896-biopygen19309